MTKNGYEASLCLQKINCNMDSTILKLVLDNNTKGLLEPRTRKSQIKLWNRFIKKWNSCNPATKVHLKDLADNLHLRWPQMYMSYSSDSLYCSFSYVDYIFHNNEDGQICGGMFIREGEKPTNAINMTASQIADLIGLIRPMPFYGKRFTDEKYEEVIDMDDDRCSGCSDHSQTALVWANRAWNMYIIGLIEEAQVACTNSLMYKRIASTGRSMGALEAEMYVVLAQTYYFTFQWELAEYCFKKCYEQYYKIFERPDWKDVLYADVPKEEREDYDDNIAGMYSYWVFRYSAFLRKTNRVKEADKVLKLHNEIIARRRNDNDDGI